MVVVCDTCTVLMVLRIAPAMFTDAGFGCTTIGTVHDEFTRTAKFADKYPWRQHYEKGIVPVTNDQLVAGNFGRCMNVVKATASAQLNTRTGKPYGLSRVDLEVAAVTRYLRARISTTDTNLREFLEQQFGVSNIMPLELLNEWLAERSLVWDDEKQRVIEDWIACREPPQPAHAISTFQRLTGRPYPRP